MCERRYGPLARIPLPHSHVVDAHTEENATSIMLHHARLYFLPPKNMKYSREESQNFLRTIILKQIIDLVDMPVSDILHHVHVAV